MITHFADLRLKTVSIQGVKQFYGGMLGLQAIDESDDTIRYRLTERCTLTFEEAALPLSPAHFAFEVPYSAFDDSVRFLRQRGIPLLQWPDGQEETTFENGRSVYFRDGDGNLLELIAHSYIRSDVVQPFGPLRILYLREAGMPADDVVSFREWLKRTLGLQTRDESDTFNFVIGGTAHVIATSTKRRWIPIALQALPPNLHVVFGAAGMAYMEDVRSALGRQGIPYSTSGDKNMSDTLHFSAYGYRFTLALAAPHPAMEESDEHD
ncbi:VOC family protein [Paenibacillus sacheonensis]|uniref:Glyoxalase/bleomycin resistance/dioxygenase family protein n=1 Tax=Paenibacillus sacheonensis TaxID=742054 RepID=A0A7X4YSL3_9BACL|nr:glyoxalase/bleomycin resistance/dioxygenase family protein [Paenibacillus sacheonensis]MBM7567209.1 catechol 2,3-dioxygenase-like lactoylglutathione lyase family enzyme [Paenibacillus sacheonensis]NBC70866.1 glyoxalase/bleomycin resistance/dioxygenase family protein [Paenibacillus sacheonensis]